VRTRNLKLLLTTVPGIEELVVREIELKFGNVVQNYRKVGITELGGRIIVESSSKELLKKLTELHTIERAFLVIQEGEIGKKIENLIEVLDKLDLSWLDDYVTNFTTLAVKSVRAGEHEYTSLDIARELGKRIVEYFKTKGKSIVINLDNPDIVVEFDVIENMYILGLELIRRSLRERKYRVFHHEASINPILAYAMNMLLEYDINKEHVIADPMCGSGTIVIEGCFHYKKSIFIGADIDYRNVRGAMKNVQKAGVDNRVVLLAADARTLSKYVRDVDGIVTNPPYGIRMTSLEKLEKLYREFIREISQVLPSGARAVIITPRRGLMNSALERVKDLYVEKQITVEQGGMLSTIFVLRKS